VKKTDPCPSMQDREKTVPLRKSEHIKICLEKDVGFKKANGFEKYELRHAALPEIDLSTVDTACTFLGKNFSAPIFIEAMTGGAMESFRINTNLAKAAQVCGIGMGLGSQRAMLLDSKRTGTYRIRPMAPNIFLVGNIGATQLKEFDLDKIKWAIEMVGADALAIHLNATQELCQIEGDTNWENILTAIENICRQIEFPIIVKETGCGLTGDMAKKLEGVGVSAIDTGGAGGTSWAKVEHFRGSDRAKLYLEWGIPTAESLAECVKAVEIPVIASGGIRNGVEIAKALSMGASLVGIALPFLKPATESTQAVVHKIEALKQELVNTMFLIGAANVEAI